MLSAQMIGSILFGIAVMHTFSIKLFQKLAHHCPKGSVTENLFHLLGEVEVIFGLWAGIFVCILLFLQGSEATIHYIDKIDFTEAQFVFAIMTIASTRPILQFAEAFIQMTSRLIPLPREISFYFIALSMGPLLGSLITEPAAMTVTALILRDRYFQKQISEKLKYLTLGTLFVNVSIGGVLTHFAAPPILMVAKTWNWNTSTVFFNFGWKAIFAVFLNTSFAIGAHWKYLKKPFKSLTKSQVKSRIDVPYWLIAMHLLTLILIVLTSHHSQVFLGIFLFFLGIASISTRYQGELKLRQSLLVAFFLGGLVVFGNFQKWWLEPLIQSLDSFQLFLGTTALTAITDNAALTYLGSQIPNVSEQFKYALISGAISGGGLTVIANAPNPAGFAILRDQFGAEGISPFQLFVSALVPTMIAMASFWLLP